MQGAVGIYLVALQPGSGEREVADMQKKIKPDNKYKKNDRTGRALPTLAFLWDKMGTILRWALIAFSGHLLVHNM